MEACPVTLKVANGLIERKHRHHKPVVGWKFGIGVKQGSLLVGAAIIGRPVSRRFDINTVAEVTRLVTDGTKNACSFLYSAAARCCREMGYAKIQTYILQEEDGTSLRAAGWELEFIGKAEDWNCSKRNNGTRRTDQPQGPKQRWAKYFKEGYDTYGKRVLTKKIRGIST